ncbi:MAG: copper amine oxidase N-terminal domain-containing protein [Filifactor alocis]|nr:copper amine oxidase N-terminal domain-containing protein [Filifactor alocis]
MKKTVALLMCLAVLVPQQVFGMQLFIGNKEVISDAGPVKVKGSVLVPISIVSDELGAKTDWNPQMRRVTVKKGETLIQLQLGNKVALVNGKKSVLEVEPQLINKRTMVPLRFVATALGEKVEYVAQTGSVLIGSDKGQVNLKKKLTKADVSKAKIAKLLSLPEKDLVEIGFMDLTGDKKEEIIVKILSHDEIWPTDVAVLTQDYKLLLKQTYGDNANGYYIGFGVNKETGNFVNKTILHGSVYYSEKASIESDEDIEYIENMMGEESERMTRLLSTFIEIPFEKF